MRNHKSCQYREPGAVVVNPNLDLIAGIDPKQSEVISSWGLCGTRVYSCVRLCLLYMIVLGNEVFDRISVVVIVQCISM